MIALAEPGNATALIERMRGFLSGLVLGLVAGLVLGLAAAIAGTMSSGAAELNDYPTAARADYVFACMKTNGETRRALEQCSCSMDVIASILTYDRYVSAETVLSLSQ